MGDLKTQKTITNQLVCCADQNTHFPKLSLSLSSYAFRFLVLRRAFVQLWAMTHLREWELCQSFQLQDKIQWQREKGGEREEKERAGSTERRRDAILSRQLFAASSHISTITSRSLLYVSLKARHSFGGGRWLASLATLSRLLEINPPPPQ